MVDKDCSVLVATAAAFAEESGPGSDYENTVYMRSADLELFGESDGSDQRYVALQFTDVGIPTGSKIKKASIQFKVDEHPRASQAGPLRVRIETEKGASTRLVEANYAELSQRANATTGTFALWALPAATAASTVGDIVTTPDISVVVQSLVNGADWDRTANKPTFLFSRDSGAGTRIFEAGDYMPTLKVQFCKKSNPINTRRCYDADTSNFASLFCGGYERAGYTCVAKSVGAGQFCAAMDPSGDPNDCAVLRQFYSTSTWVGLAIEPRDRTARLLRVRLLCTLAICPLTPFLLFYF